MVESAPARVLHVTDCFAGGVGQAIRQYVNNTPELEHVLLSIERRYEPDMADPPRALRVRRCAQGHLGALRAVRQVMVEERPTVVHAHSTFGGLYVALARLSLRRPPRGVYSPHGFAFLRQDRPAWQCRIFRLEERLRALLDRSTIACVGVAEREHALKVAPRRTACIVRHAPLVPVAVSAGRAARDSGAFELITIGRICAQKDPQFLIETLRELRAQHPELEIHCQWVGDGSADLRASLEAAGVEIVGWVEPAQVISRLRHAHAYVHTAAWEGEPIVLVEALLVGLRCAVRAIDATRPFGDWVSLADDPASLAAVLASLEASNEERDERNERCRDVESVYNPQTQAAQLMHAYGMSGRGPEALS